MFEHSSFTQRIENQILQKTSKQPSQKCYTPLKQMHDSKLNFFAIKSFSYIVHPRCPKSITSKMSTELQSINAKCRPNNEKCKIEMHNLQITSYIKNRKEETKVLRPFKFHDD